MGWAGREERRGGRRGKEWEGREGGREGGNGVKPSALNSH